MIFNEDNENRTAVKDFLTKYDGFNSIKAQEAYLKTIIKNEGYYVPYLTKDFFAKKIIETSNFNANGEVVYNGVKQYQCYIWALLIMYTNLDVSEIGFDQVFDELNKRKIIDKLVEMLPKDFKEFEIVFGMVATDFDKNHQEVHIDSNKMIQNIEFAVLKGVKDIFDILASEETLNIIKNLEQSVESV